MSNHKIGDIVVATDQMKFHYPRVYDGEFEVVDVFENDLPYTGGQFIRLKGDRSLGYYGNAFKKKEDENNTF